MIVLNGQCDEMTRNTEHFFHSVIDMGITSDLALSAE